MDSNRIDDLKQIFSSLLWCELQNYDSDIPLLQLIKYKVLRAWHEYVRTVCGNVHIDNYNQYKNLRKDNFITSALNNTYILDSFKLSQIVNNIFKTKYPVYDKMKSFHNNYNSSILSERNKLAHAKKEPETDGAFYFVDPKSGEKTVYNSQKCRRIRREIIFYNQLLDEAIDVIV